MNMNATPTLWAGLLGSCVEVVGEPEALEMDLHPDEWAYASRQAWAPSRLHDYIRGRRCAQLALRRLACTAAPVLTSETREPIWPAGFAGSITHSPGLALAAAARMPDVLGVGLDVERAGAVSSNVLRLISTEDDFEMKPQHWPESVWRTALFSAKEAVFKAVFPRTRRFLDFRDVCIRFQEDEQFIVSAVAPWAASLGLEALQGSVRISKSYVITGVVWSNAIREN